MLEYIVATTILFIPVRHIAEELFTLLYQMDITLIHMWEPKGLSANNSRRLTNG